MTQAAMTTASRAVPPPPPPVQPLDYPIIFASAATDSIDNEHDVNADDHFSTEQRNREPLRAPSQHTSLRHSAALNSHTVTLFNALHWLRIVFEQARWLMPSEYSSTCTYAETKSSHTAPSACAGDSSSSSSNNSIASNAAAAADVNDNTTGNDAGEKTEETGVAYEDVRAARALLPRFDRFFTLTETIVPKHSAPYVTVESFTMPTTKGPRTITRSKVEGDHRARHSQPVHAPDKNAMQQSLSSTIGVTLTQTTVTNSSAYFSLLPGHNQFLLYYEEVCKLCYFNYVELDKLRFAWVAMRELFDESKMFHRSDGSLTGFAKRDLRSNNASSPFALSLDQTASHNNSYGRSDNNNLVNKSKHKNGSAYGGNNFGVVAAEASHTATVAATHHTRAGGIERDLSGQGSSSTTTATTAKSKSMIGRGGGNARLNQGTSGNVITGPSKEALELRREAAQKRFMKQQLEEECTRRWPHTPPHKSCIYVIESKQECELPDEVVALLAVRASNLRNRNNTVRKGPRYYFATVELPLLNKKGNVARFRAARWCTSQADAENAAAEAALLALPTFKSFS